MDATELTCTICGQTKPLDSFTPNKASRLGRMKQCKECRSARERARHEADPHKRRDRRNAYRREHPEVRERERVYEEATKERHNRRARERRALDKDSHNAYQRAYKARDREKWAAYYRARRAANPEEARAASLRFYYAHRAEALAANRAWCRAHPERMREKNRRYLRANPAAVIAMSQRRRAREVGAEGSFTAREWRALCAFYEQRCLCCDATDRVLSADHVVPLSRGGTNYIFNLQPLCGACNSAKGTKETDDRTRSFGEFLDYLETYPYRRRPKHTLLSIASLVRVVPAPQE